MGGVVSGINVKEGQQVNEGDKIAELEAMKMKVPVMASRSGQVFKVCVAVGDAEAGQGTANTVTPSLRQRKAD